MVGMDRLSPAPAPARMGPRNRRQGTAALLVVAALAAGGLADVGHVVAPGENLFTLARKYLTTPQDIARANHIADPNLIVIGMNLRIPGRAGAPAGTCTGNGSAAARCPGGDVCGEAGRQPDRHRRPLRGDAGRAGRPE